MSGHPAGLKNRPIVRSVAIVVIAWPAAWLLRLSLDWLWFHLWFNRPWNFSSWLGYTILASPMPALAPPVRMYFALHWPTCLFFLVVGGIVGMCFGRRRWLLALASLYVAFIVISRLQGIGYLPWDVPSNLRTFYLVTLGLIVGHGVLGAMLGARWRERKRRPAGYCDKCGYDPRGNESHICPECGTPFDCIKPPRLR